MNNNVSIAIRKIIVGNNLDKEVANILYRTYKYIHDNQWWGACHACASVIYVALCEIGQKPELCIGEAKAIDKPFDHSWIRLNNKIIDIPICMTLKNGSPANAPVIMNMDISNNEKTTVKYGIKYIGLDLEASIVLNLPFVEYMDMYPGSERGLWDVVEIVLNKKINVEKAREKYKNVKRRYEKEFLC